ncbi:MAG: ATP synthase F0 subunit B [Oscillibacter sp.]|nr:ATP synthase F0 subunit B [Oscillibacter sp.]
MSLPLNIDLQQILLHWMNLAILTGGLYFLLFKPVKQFMDKREAEYRQRDGQAAEKLAEAEELKAQYQAKMDAADEEIRQARSKAQQAVQQSAEEQLAQARVQAQQIVSQAQAEAVSCKERIRRESQKELKELAAAAAKKLAIRSEGGKDLFDQFLDLTEGGEQPHEKR